MDADFKGSSEHAAQHQHGVQVRPEPPAPQTVEQRVASLERKIADHEERVAKLEAAEKARTKIPAEKRS